MRYRILLQPPAMPQAPRCADPRAALAPYLDELARFGVLLDVQWAPEASEAACEDGVLAAVLVEMRSHAEAQEWARRLPTASGPLAGHRVDVAEA